MKMDETLSGRFVMECLAALMAVERRTAELEGDASQSEDATVREIGSGVAGNYRRILEMLNERLSELSWRDMRGEPLTVAKMRDALDRGEDRWTISRVDHGTADWGTEPVASFVIPSPWVNVKERLPESDGWYHVAVHDYKGRYPRHELAEFTLGRFWIPGDNGEGDSVFAWRGPALPPLPAAEVEE